MRTISLIKNCTGRKSDYFLAIMHLSDIGRFRSVLVYKNGIGLLVVWVYDTTIATAIVSRHSTTTQLGQAIIIASKGDLMKNYQKLKFYCFDDEWKI